MKPIEAKSGSGQQLSSSEIEQKVEVAPWRYGPAAYWYDQMGVNETGDKFDYGFKLKQVSIEPFLPSWVTWLKQTVNNQDFDASSGDLCRHDNILG